MRKALTKIISGGQAGADRGGLDFAIEHGIPHGGYCPKGRRSEDGVIPPEYSLTETPSRDYPQRTEWNVRDSDGTAVISIAAELTGGSAKTVRLAEKHGKPCVHLSKDRDGVKAPELLAKFIEQYRIKILNVAGPRASKEPAVGGFVGELLVKAIASS